MYFCLDINECMDHNGHCQQICNDLRIGFECSCHSGYVLAENKKNCDGTFFSFFIWFDVSFSTSHADIVKSNETLINFPLLTWSIQIACKILQLFVSISRDNLIELIT